MFSGSMNPIKIIMVTLGYYFGVFSYVFLVNEPNKNNNGNIGLLCAAILNFTMITAVFGLGFAYITWSRKTRRDLTLVTMSMFSGSINPIRTLIITLVN